MPLAEVMPARQRDPDDNRPEWLMITDPAFIAEPRALQSANDKNDKRARTDPYGKRKAG